MGLRYVVKSDRTSPVREGEKRQSKKPEDECSGEKGKIDRAARGFKDGTPVDSGCRWRMGSCL